MRFKILLFCVLINIFLFPQDLKRIYIANDDHTDYMWTADEEEYKDAFIEMLDYYLNLADETDNEAPEHQSRWNCDGHFWVWTYEKNKSESEFQRLINRIKSGHISVPLNPLSVLYGGVPAEAAIRGMYYAGKLERKYDIRFKLAYSMENQTLPYGLSSLWAGAGAKYSWKGICNCATKIPDVGEREHQIYWDSGPDDSKILTKWYSHRRDLHGGIGTYSEVKDLNFTIDYLDSSSYFNSNYPYNIIGAFGRGGDNLKTITDDFVKVAKEKTNSSRLIIVSNEQDFFEDFESSYGNDLPSISKSYGNEWDLYCASLAEVSAGVKRSVEKLRSAEALATLVSIKNPSFLNSRIEERDQAWMDLGLYWEHDWTADPNPEVIPLAVSRGEREEWQRKLASRIEDYVTSLYEDSRSALGNMIEKTAENEQFFVFNPLSWVRTDYADYEYQGNDSVHVVDLSTMQETASQIIQKNGKKYIRILAKDIPSVGYKTFEIRSGNGTGFQNSINISNGVIDNSKYEITVSNSGAITSLIDKNQDDKQFSGNINGKYLNDLGGNSGTINIENSGPVSSTITVTSSSPLNHKTKITLFNEIDRIEISNEITQNFSDILTWNFGFNIDNPDIWHEEVGAVINAKLTEQGGHYSSINARYDWLTLNHFADISNNGSGVTLSNADCYFMKIGESTPDFLDVNQPNISVLAGGQVDGSALGIQNQGGDDYFLQRFALKTHSDFDQISAMKFSLEHQNPFTTGTVTGNSSEYPPDSFSFLTLDNPSIILWALKPADDGVDNGIITRLWNFSEDTENFNITFNSNDIIEADIVSHIETPVEPADFNQNILNENISKKQIKSFSVTLTGLTSDVGLNIFDGKIDGENVALRWRISGEINCEGYELYRNDSLIAFIKGSGTNTITNHYKYIDSNPTNGSYTYKLFQINFDSNKKKIGEVFIDFYNSPDKFQLFQNYPNPFNPVTKIKFALPKKSITSVKIYNLIGEEMLELVNKEFDKGYHEIEFNAASLSSGIYFYQVKAENFVETKKLILQK